MKVWIVKGDFEWFKEMGSEGRTRSMDISTCKRFEDSREIEMELNTLK